MAQKYVEFDSNGRLVAFYDDAIHPLPGAKLTVSIKLSDDDYDKVKVNPNGYRVAGNQLITAPSNGTDAALAKRNQSLVDAYNVYNSVLNAKLQFTSDNGETHYYQTDKDSVDQLQLQAQTYGIVGATPAGFYWLDIVNNRVPFTLADLRGLLVQIVTRNQVAFQNYQEQKRALGL